jgi:hypothetical protein
VAAEGNPQAFRLSFAAPAEADSTLGPPSVFIPSNQLEHPSMRLLLFCLSLAAVQAQAAEFEGIISGKATGNPERTGTMKMYVSSKGVRMEISGIGQKSEAIAGGIAVTMIWQASDPDNFYALNPATKTYLKRDFKKAQQAASTAPAPKLEKLGAASFLGRSVQKVKLTFEGGRTQEMWMDTSLHFPASALVLFGQQHGAHDSTWKAMEQAGVAGIPLKEVDADGKTGWEATSLEKKSLPSSLFQLPDGFHEAKNPLEMLSPEQQAALKAKMDAMTPEQRAHMEEMRKAIQQQQQH